MSVDHRYHGAGVWVCVNIKGVLVNNNRLVTMANVTMQRLFRVQAPLTFGHNLDVS